MHEPLGVAPSCPSSKLAHGMELRLLLLHHLVSLYPLRMKRQLQGPGHAAAPEDGGACLLNCRLVTFWANFCSVGSRSRFSDHSVSFAGRDTNPS